MKTLVILSVIFTIAILFVCATSYGYEHGAIAEIQTEIDYKSSTEQNDLTVRQAYLSWWAKSQDGGLYIRSNASNDVYISNGDTINYEGQRLFVEELYCSFNMLSDRIDWKLGKAISPFGFDYYGRPEKSVFVSTPKEDFYVFGLFAGYKYKNSALDLSYVGDGGFSSRVSVEVAGFDNLSVSYSNIDKINNTYGKCALSNSIRFKYLFFGASNLTEYNPDSGSFWDRVVVFPGRFDFLGLFAGYHNNIEKYDERDFWAYGFFVDISPNATASFEWSNSLVLNPITLSVMVRF